MFISQIPKIECENEFTDNKTHDKYANKNY